MTGESWYWEWGEVDPMGQSMNQLCPMPGCRVERVTQDGPASLHITAHGLGKAACCPACGQASRAVHSRYDRHPADLPSLGRTTRLGLHIRRFHCRNLTCPRRTFAERLPGLLAPYARRTHRLAEAQGRVGVALEPVAVELGVMADRKPCTFDTPD